MQLVLGRELYDCWTASLGPRPLLFEAAETLLKAVCEHSAFVVTSQWALPPTPTGATVPDTAEVLAETGLLRKDASLWVWGCTKCLGPLAEAGAGEGSILTCRGMLWLRSSIEVKELWEVRRLHSTRNDEKEIDKLFTEKLQR